MLFIITDQKSERDAEENIREIMSNQACREFGMCWHSANIIKIQHLIN